jgi:hypothetical protein
LGILIFLNMRKGRQVLAVPMTMKKLIPAALCAFAALAVSPSQAQQATEVHVTYS